MKDRLGRPPALLVAPAALATLLLLVPLVAMVASTSWQELPGHLTSTAALAPGDKIECGVDGIGTLKVTIGQPA